LHTFFNVPIILIKENRFHTSIHPPYILELHVFHANVNGLRARKDELECYLRETKPDIVLLNETKLGNNPTPRIAGYTKASVRNRTTDRTQGGGVAIFVKKGLQFTDISPDVDDLVAIEIRLANVSFAFVSYYNPPHLPSINVTALLPYIQKYDHCVIGGDLNAKHQYFGCKTTNLVGEHVFDLVEQHDLIIANEPGVPTRHAVSTGSTEMLDYFVVSKRASRLLTDCYVGEDVGSDHFPLHLKLRLKGHIDMYPKKMCRVMSSCNWERYADHISESIEEIDDKVLAKREAVDARCEQIRSIATAAIDIACPMKPVREYAFRLTKETLALIRYKRKIRRLCQKTPGSPMKTLYNNLCRQVSDAVKSEKQRSWEDATSSLDGLNGRRLWSKFKLLAGVHSSDRTSVRVNDSTGTLTPDEQSTAQEFATHLAQVHNTHNGPEFCTATRSAVDNRVKSKAIFLRPCFRPMPEDGDESPLAQPVTVPEITKALQSCKTNSAPGEDQISYTMLKHPGPWEVF
jgi:exonuclease III